MDAHNFEYLILPWWNLPHIFSMAITATTTAGSWSFGAVDSGFYGKIILDDRGGISIQMLEGGMELNALYLTDNDGVSLLDNKTVGGDKIKGLREDREYKFIKDYQGNTKIESLYEVTEQEKLEIDKASSSLNMNGVKDDEGSSVKWDSMVSIDSTGLAGDTSYLLDASTENSTYTLDAEQTKTLLGSFDSFEGLNFGVRGTSVGVDQEESVKLYSDSFVKDKVYVDEFDVSRGDPTFFEENKFVSFGAELENKLASTSEQAFVLADAATATKYDEATGSSYSQLIDSADDRFLIAGKWFEFNTKTSLWGQYDSMEMSLQAGQQVQIGDSDALIDFVAKEAGVYSLTKEGLFRDDLLVSAARATEELIATAEEKVLTEAAIVGDFDTFNVRSDSDIGIDFTLNTNYNLGTTSEELITTNEALVSVA